MTGVLARRGGDTKGHTQRRQPRGDRDRDWSDVASSQRVSRTVGNQTLEEARKEPLVKMWRDRGPADTLSWEF